MSGSLIPNAKQQFIDANGNPLAGGFVYYYIPSTTTFKNTYQNAALTILNTNPIVLDSAGECIAYGAGSYRQIVTDVNGNLIWDQPTISIVTNDAANVIYTPPFANAVAETVSAKLSETVSVKDFGAKGDGTTNDTNAIQNAINASSSVYFPSGTYLSDTVNLKANTFLYGDGSATIIKQNTITSGSYGTFFADSASSSATLDNITIRDMRIEAPNIVTPVFSQFQHLVSLNGVKNVLIENVDFIGFYGDGLYIGSGAASGQERHNINVTVRSCFFDGVNKENRNAISVVDCDGMIIDGNYFTRTTKSTMPGAIDIEPDSNTYHIVKDFKIINNKFYNIGGNVAAIGISLPAIVYVTPPNGFIIENNYVDTVSANGFSFVYRLSGGISEGTFNFGLFVSNNTFKNGANPFSIFGAKDVVIDSNQFLNFTNSALVGYSTVDEKCINVSLLNNLFYYCGTSGAGIGLAIGFVTRINIKGNEFNDCGTGVAGSANALDFNTTATSSSISIIENNFVSPNAKTLVAIQVEGTHTLTPSTNIYSNNRLNSLPNNFDWRIGDIQLYAAAPTTGAWLITNYVYNSAPTTGQPQGWVCSASGSPGTWKAMANLA